MKFDLTKVEFDQDGITSELDDKIKRGLIASDLEPIKCECGCTSFRDVITSREDSIISYIYQSGDISIRPFNADFEYDRFCRSCKVLAGSWAHGSWIP